MASMNKILFELLGSPFSDRPLSKLTAPDLFGVYGISFNDPVPLLDISLDRRERWD